MEFKIEKGIAIPERKGGTVKYPFEQMEVGDSFFVPESAEVRRSNFSNSASSYGKRTGKKFTVRKVEGGWRCWRVE